MVDDPQRCGRDVADRDCRHSGELTARGACFRRRAASARMTRYPPWGTVGTAAIARWALAPQAGAVRIEGLEHIPASGPVMLVARHFHHLLDGAVLVRYVPRPVHIVAGLDWAANARERTWMERACRAVQWPIVLRAATLGQRDGYAPDELMHYTRTGVRDAVALLRA